MEGVDYELTKGTKNMSKVFTCVSELLCFKIPKNRFISVVPYGIASE